MPWWLGVRVPASGPSGSPYSTRDLFVHKHGQHSPCGMTLKFERGIPAQVLPSLSDHGSKLRDSTQNTPNVSSKWNFNLTKSNQIAD
ncbi:hypothetical protein AVEN_55926-1 [Araneus ventricosus]|uniref:Uncharacterized protein n=1 Tax=Araneus ventricosus TaxID=182803 RepID=A0A4Y2MZV6_ARAVE|nr:hypothetical protein AVEN_229218-1 [Araneus ventricosus]GBN32691.1 hypothetical protein AVEN_55926-1 [Araneus ventricosus]